MAQRMWTWETVDRYGLRTIHRDRSNRQTAQTNRQNDVRHNGVHVSVRTYLPCLDRLSTPSLATQSVCILGYRLPRQARVVRRWSIRSANLGLHPFAGRTGGVLDDLGILNSKCYLIYAVDGHLLRYHPFFCPRRPLLFSSRDHLTHSVFHSLLEASGVQIKQGLGVQCLEVMRQASSVAQSMRVRPSCQWPSLHLSAGEDQIDARKLGPSGPGPIQSQRQTGCRERDGPVWPSRPRRGAELRPSRRRERVSLVRQRDVRV